MDRYDAVIASTLLDAHGEKLTRGALDHLAKSVNRSFIPIGIEHDPRVAPIGRLSSAFVRERPDGESEVVAVMEVFEDSDDLHGLDDSREMVLDAERCSGIAVSYDWTHRGADDQADISAIAVLLGNQPRYDAKKSAEPISVITLAMGFVAGGIATGFLGQIGVDAWNAIKGRIAAIFARKHLRKGDQLLVFSFLLKHQDRNVEVSVILTNPSPESIDAFLERGLLSVEQVLPIYCHQSPDLRRLAFEAKGDEINLLFGVRKDCRALRATLPVKEILPMVTTLDAQSLDVHDTIEFVLFKDSEESFSRALQENNVEYTVLQPIPGTIRASGVVIEVAQAIVTSGAIASVLIAWLKARASRKIIATTTDFKVLHLEGYSVSEVKAILPLLKSAAIIDTKPAD